WPAHGKVAFAADGATGFARFAGDDERDQGIWRTLNANAPHGREITWERLRGTDAWLDESQGTYNLCLAIDRADPRRIATGMQRLWVSTNALANRLEVSWALAQHSTLNDEGLRAHHADHHDLVVAGPGPQLWVANDGGISRSRDWTTAGAISGGRPL